MENEKYSASWRISKVCNFKCKYCYKKTNIIKPVFYVDTMRRILRETGKDWTISIIGGEPFLYPDFIQLCRQLTEDFPIIIESNLSLSALVRDFADTIMPKRVKHIATSLHIEEREKKGGIGDFIETFHYLRKKGFNLIVNYVLHPTLIARFPQDYEYFRSHDIMLLPHPFRGWYRTKMYPRAYSKEEKKLIISHKPNATFYPFCFKGLNCNAGRTFIRIEPDGTVMRCLNDNTVLGHMNKGIQLYETAKPCPVYRCLCFGYHLIEGQKFDRHNTNYNYLHLLARCGNISRIWKRIMSPNK